VTKPQPLRFYIYATHEDVAMHKQVDFTARKADEFRRLPEDLETAPDIALLNGFIAACLRR
jgi:hypothetical protein